MRVRPVRRVGAERELTSELHYSGVSRRGLFSKVIRLGVGATGSGVAVLVCSKKKKRYVLLELVPNAMKDTFRDAFRDASPARGYANAEM